MAGDLYDDINRSVTFNTSTLVNPIKEEVTIIPTPENRVSTDDIEELNTFPEPVLPEKDVSLPQDAPRTTVDFFQVHEHGSDFNI